MRTSRRGQLAIETNKERDIRLETISTHRRERLATETAEERELQLQQMREHDCLAQETVQERLPSFQLLDQPSTQAKMKKFHSYFSSLHSPTCSTCLESFPGLQLRSPSTECARCYQDKHTPKVYSSGNNIDPGPIPPDLQVCHFMKMMYCMGG